MQIPPFPKFPTDAGSKKSGAQGSPDSKAAQVFSNLAETKAILANELQSSSDASDDASDVNDKEEG